MVLWIPHVFCARVIGAQPEFTLDAPQIETFGKIIVVC